jgi:D-3-phosphoglycerate dehydrogenase
MSGSTATWEQIDLSQLPGADAIVTWHASVDAEMIAHAEHCLVIVILGPGCGPHAPRVDLEAARRAGIYVASIPDYASDGWAEETMALIEEVAATAGLGLALKPGPGQTPKPALRGVRLGIVGLGQVGRRVARLARARGMELWAHDPFCPENPFHVLGVRPAPLEDLLGLAQVVSLHVPLGPATRGMLNADRLNLIQRNTALVNASAPELIDLAALAGSLQRGRPAVAAFLGELTLPAEHPLSRLPGLIQRPCRADMTEEAWREALSRALRIVRSTCRGERPPHLLIDPPCPRQAEQPIMPDGALPDA